MIPAFAELPVLEGVDGDTPSLRPAKERATIRQLVTHTTGLAYWFWNADIAHFHHATGTPTVLTAKRRPSPPPS